MVVVQLAGRGAGEMPEALEMKVRMVAVEFANRLLYLYLVLALVGCKHAPGKANKGTDLANKFCENEFGPNFKVREEHADGSLTCFFRSPTADPYLQRLYALLLKARDEQTTPEVEINSYRKELSNYIRSQCPRRTKPLITHERNVITCISESAHPREKSLKTSD